VVRGIAIAVAVVSAVDILRRLWGRLWGRGRSLYSWTYILENVALGTCIPVIFSDTPGDAFPEAVLVGLAWGIGAFFLDLALWYSIDRRSWNEDRPGRS
jgi:hypothetical protein